MDHSQETMKSPTTQQQQHRQQPQQQQQQQQQQARGKKRRRTMEAGSSTSIPASASKQAANPQAPPGSSSGSSVAASAADKPVVNCLMEGRRWEEAEEYMRQHPEQVRSSHNPSPLALACRLGAPYDCIETALRLCPAKLRHLLDSRGTPLHEAIVCEEVGPDLIRLLLDADEALGTSSPRAAVMQDVDGYVPLHLLIRRRFQSHVMGQDVGNGLMEILEMLVKSCAEAVVVPDRGEYEEPPIVMALKANVYAPLLQSEDETIARIERNIHEMLRCMLRHYPQAASCVFRGYRGQYTALHSAVFHGRCPETLELLLTAEARCPSDYKSTLLANTQEELPLHFCTMRGEPPRSVALLAEAAPEAMTRRDASGLTPMHWLWIRFVSNLLALEGGRGATEVMRLEVHAQQQQAQQQAQQSTQHPYTSFTSLHQGDFEADLQLIRRLDPSVDFLRMRHIPEEVLGVSDSIHWAERAIALLQHVRERHEVHQGDNNDNNEEEEGQFIEWTRLEAVASLFWTKVVALLRAAWLVTPDHANEQFSVVKMAFATPCCPPPIARIAVALFPHEMSHPDSNGKLPLHHAADRTCHHWDFPGEDATSTSASARLLTKETISVLKLAMSTTPKPRASHRDNTRRVPMHYVIPSLVEASCVGGRSCIEHPVYETLEIIRKFVSLHPEGIQQADPESGLVPFLQATAEATKHRSASSGGFASPFPDEPSLSIVYSLLREDQSSIRIALER